MTDSTQELDLDGKLDASLEGLHEAGCDYIELQQYPNMKAAGMAKCNCYAADVKQEIKNLFKEMLDRLDKETERCQDGCWVSIKAERNQLEESK